MSFVVLKFGGTSVATAARWRTIAAVTRARVAEGHTPVLVCSALAGVSDLLEGLLDAALRDEHGLRLTEIEALHRALGADLDLKLPWLDETLAPVHRLAAGAALVGEISPRMRAAVLATGELLSTRLGGDFLRADGLDVRWEDARTSMTTHPQDGGVGYLSAHCDDAADPAVTARFAGAEVIITQGFIAHNRAGETVLLGRGGSDTSAALFAAKLGAQRCEIWTDVPGIYTANPRDIPDARMLRLLDYDEAQEIATAGASVLHPRCIAPVRRHGIPLHIRCTLRPELEGTVICGDAPSTAEVKAISARRGVTLVSMTTLGMWQQVGFLADAFGVFKRNGISVDLVSTSETNVTASFDPGAGVVDATAIDALLEDLSEHCEARLISNCAAVTLVGRHIRAILHQLGPALSVFEAQRIHLVSQAASDLNLTFVVDASQADRLVRQLHVLLFGEKRAHAHLGPSWRETFGGGAVEEVPHDEPWWRTEAEALLAEADRGTPAYIYHGPSIDRAAQGLAGMTAVDRVFYAIKANDQPDILRRIAGAGLGFECVSPGELAHVQQVCPEVGPDRILFTPNFVDRSEYQLALELGVWTTIDAVQPLELWPDVFRDQPIVLRLDPGRGRGHHAYVRTAGAQSKFGIALDELPRARDAAAAAGARVVGLHAHAGSGIRDAAAWQETAAFLLDATALFPEVKYLDLGGGLGVREKPGQRALDLDEVNARLQTVKAARPDLGLWLEPGRYLVAEAGVLLARVNQTKTKAGLRYVGVDAGMHTLIRPALYGAWHGMVNLSRLDAPRIWRCNIVGPICETGDTLGYDRRLPVTEPGDVVLIATAGAYGRTMSSDYNRRGRAREQVLN
jgi:diaminopimelate decarboxylase/aspartate kinase